MNRRGVLAGILAFALILTSVPAPMGTASAASDDPSECIQNPRTTAEQADIIATAEYEYGNDVKLTYSTEGVSSEFTVHPKAVKEVDSAVGFENTSTGWTWDGETPDPHITYESQSVSSDDWGAGVFRKPVHTGADVRVEAASGTVSRELMLLGSEYTVRTVQNGCEEIRLIIPCGLHISEGRADVMDSLDDASEEMDVGNRHSTVTVFATENVRGFGLLGVYFGDGDTAVRADTEVDAGNTWVHEYVHSRQNHDANTARNMSWFTEASATYYAGELTKQQGEIRQKDLTDELNSGVNDGTTLANPNTWNTRTPYDRGSLFLGALDERIREDTNGSATLQDVFREVNSRENVTYTEFREIVADTSSEDTAAWMDEYVQTDATPEYSPPEQDRSAFAFYFQQANGKVEAIMETVQQWTNPSGHCSRGWFLS